MRQHISNALAYIENPRQRIDIDAYLLYGRYANAGALSFRGGLENRLPNGTGVRIPHPKIEELALQAQGAGIFTSGEYPLLQAYAKK